MVNVNGTRVWEVICQKCGSVIHVHGNKALAVKQLRGYGWAIGKKCLCSVCRETPQNFRNWRRVI